MRISDWSSDVCSSDLPLRAGVARTGQGGGLPYPRQPHGRAQEVRQGQGAPQLPVLEALNPTVLENRVVPATAPPFFMPRSTDGSVRNAPRRRGGCLRAARTQIGRASCRERVCQYV